MIEKFIVGPLLDWVNKGGNKLSRKGECERIFYFSLVWELREKDVLVSYYVM